MSGAVGAICLQCNVEAAIERRVWGGVSRYLNMSFNGWPELTNNVVRRSGTSAFDEEAAVLLSLEVESTDPEAMRM